MFEYDFEEVTKGIWCSSCSVVIVVCMFLAALYNYVWYIIISNTSSSRLYGGPIDSFKCNCGLKLPRTFSLFSGAGLEREQLFRRTSYAQIKLELLQLRYDVCN